MVVVVEVEGKAWLWASKHTHKHTINNEFERRTREKKEEPELTRKIEKMSQEPVQMRRCEGKKFSKFAMEFHD